MWKEMDIKGQDLSTLGNKMVTLKKKLKTLWWRVKSIFAIYYYGNTSTKIKIVGVTGTSGKTTTATLLYRVTIALGYKAGLIGTVENIVVNEVREATLTTPDSVTLTKLFKDMADKGCEYVFMEASSHAIDQGRLLGIKFTGGIFTNLTQDHFDYHKNFENYFQAKKKFFQMLPANAFALSNTDSEYGLRMLEGIEAKKYTYGFKNKADFSEKLETKLLGEFNMYNALAVYSALVLLGMDKDRVKEAMKNVEPPCGRFEHFTTPSGVLVIVDYAHKPDALEKIFEAVKPMKVAASKLISVFGCGGDRDPLKRPIMGKTGAVNSDIAIFTSDNPRSEDPDKIIEEMKTSLSTEELKKVLTIPDRREAILESVKLAKRGDIILCAGKGHEDYQIIKGVKHHFDDIEEFRKAYAK